MSASYEDATDAIPMTRGSANTTSLRNNERGRLMKIDHTLVHPNEIEEIKWEKSFELSEELILKEGPGRFSTEKIKVLIFNNNFTKKENEREGSIYDRNDLHVKFKNLGYTVKMYDEEETGDLTKDILFNQIKGVLEEDDYDCLITVIMTHGNLSEMKASDVNYSVKDLLDLFKEKKKDIPKLIILNACRDENEQQKSGFFPELQVDNCVVVYTAYPGKSAYRSSKGTRLIRIIRVALQKLIDLGEERLVIDLFTDIKRHVSTKTNVENTQMPIVVFNLTKRFYIGKVNKNENAKRQKLESGDNMNIEK